MKLSKNSKEMMIFFSKHKHINYSRQTKATKNILTDLYMDILEAYNYVKTHSINKPSIKNIISASRITKPKFFNKTSFPEIIINYIDNKMTTELAYNFSLYDRNITVYFVLEKGYVEKDLELYNKYIELIIIWLYIGNIYGSKQCATTLKIYFYFTSLEKHLPSSTINILNDIHVNTAFTTTCPKDSEIVIFRKEEWFKVLIHESFHNFGLDFSGMADNMVDDCMLNIFKVKSGVGVNAFEAYTEFWAEILNSLICVFYEMKHKDDIDDFLSKTETIINYERTYSLFQLVKTLDFMGLNYTDLYSNTKNSSLIRENLYKEETSVLSYYIIKGLMMNNYQGFLGWCSKNNATLLDFKKTMDNQSKFCKFIERNYKTSSMMVGIHESQFFLSKLKKKKDISNNILSTMRMSICELG
jgi:hypothetical protein